jgi:HEAT repeat protein
MVERTKDWWRLVPEVRSRERGRFLFFASLMGLLNLAQVMGFAGAEALFLGRVGVAQLPLAFVGASAAAVLLSLAYASVVGRARNDRLFVWMLVAAAVLLPGGAAGAFLGVAWAPTALFIFFFVTEAIFVTHYMTFVGDYFDTLSSKRMFPLFAIGSSLGGALGGSLVVLVLRVAPAESLILCWAAGLAACAALLRARRGSLRRWGPLGLEESDETSVEGLRGALRHLRRSPFGRWLVLSALGMVLALFLSQYLYSDIFARNFPDVNALATFFGVYLAVTNAIEILVERYVTPWLIRHLGVASANLVHPVLTVASFLILAIDYRLGAAIAARVNREMLDSSLSMPVRNLVYNAIPLRFRGRMRAFLEGIVIYSGMSVAGLVLLFAGRPDPLWLCGIGAATAMLYLLANARVRRAYLDTLVTELRAGRLDLSDVGEELGKTEVARLGELWEALLPSASEHPASEVLELAPLLARRGATAPLSRGATHANPRVRRACIAALGAVSGEPAFSALLPGLEDPDPEVRLTALRVLHDHPPVANAQHAIERCLTDDDPRVRAEAALLSTEAGLRLLEQMAASSDAAEATAALVRLPASHCALAVTRLGEPDAAIRAAALSCLARLGAGEELRKAGIETALDDPDPAVRRAAADALAVLADPAASRALAVALKDSLREVRTHVSERLGELGDVGITAAEPYLRDVGQWTVDAALEAISAACTPRARAVLGQELRARVHRSWESLLALEALGQGESPWMRALRLAHEDAFARSGRTAFRILELLEGVSLMQSVQHALRLGSRRARANALEVIANLGDREASELLVLLLEEGVLRDKMRAVAGHFRPPRDSNEVVSLAEASSDRWIGCALRARNQTEDRETMEQLLALRQVSLFAHLSLDQLEAIRRATKTAQYVEGEVIVREGDPGTELFVLLEGEVKVYREWGSAQPTLLNTLAPVSYFGEIAILDGEQRSATVVASRDSTLLSLRGERLKELILQTPEISFELFRGLITRFRAAEQRLEESRPERGTPRES